jgi:hypothetical protein
MERNVSETGLLRHEKHTIDYLYAILFPCIRPFTHHAYVKCECNKCVSDAQTQSTDKHFTFDVFYIIFLELVIWVLNVNEECVKRSATSHGCVRSTVSYVKYRYTGLFWVIEWSNEKRFRYFQWSSEKCVVAYFKACNYILLMLKIAKKMPPILPILARICFQYLSTAKEKRK